MATHAEETISLLMKRFRAQNEADLARILKVGQSTISTWKSRGKVPDRVRRIAEGEHSLALGTTPLNWEAHEQAALGLALSRFYRVFGNGDAQEDFEAAMKVATHSADVWSLFSEAQKDIMAAAEDDPEGLPSTALALLVHRDCQDKDAAVRRDKAIIETRRPSVEF